MNTQELADKLSEIAIEYPNLVIRALSPTTNQYEPINGFAYDEHTLDFVVV